MKQEKLQCGTCKKWLLPDEFYKDRNSKVGYYYQCKRCEKIRQKKWYEKNKNKILNKMLKQRKKRKPKQKIEKHRHKTCPMCEEKKSVDKFDTTKSGYNRRFCKKCYAIDKNLVQLYKESGYSTEELMLQFNCSKITINNKLKGYNRLKVHKQEQNSTKKKLITKINTKKLIIREEKIRYFYEEKGLNMAQCAEKFNCTRQNIYDRIKELGIKRVWKRTCKICSKKFTTNNNNKIYCSVKCREYAQGQNQYARETFLIFKRDKFKCIYCGNSSIIDGVKLHCDHIKPKYESGTDEAKNLVTSCQECNLAKNNARLEPSTEKQILKEVAKRNKLNDILPDRIIKFPKRLYSIKRKKT